MKTDYNKVHVDIKNGVAVLTMNNPPVNQFSADFTQELGQAIMEALDDDAVKALILTGTGGTFIAGGDINLLKAVEKREDILPGLMSLHELFNAFEGGRKPVIAAINGNCLGGGLELAMACHHRVAVPTAKLGLPEVQLGLLPGSAGTQRMPRLVGLQRALDLMTSGRQISADKALLYGLIHEIVPADKLMDKAMEAVGLFQMGLANVRARAVSKNLGRLPSAAEKAAVLGFAKMQIAQKSKGYIAPLKIVEALEKGLTADFQTDIEREAELFADCATSDVAKNMMNMFLTQRSAGRLPRIKDVKPTKPQKVAQLGGGVMGCGIVHLLLAGGFDCVLWDINPEALAKGVESVKKTFAFQIKKKKMKSADLDRLIAEKLTTTTKLEDLGDVDLIIEAVLEDMKVKQDIWLTLEKTCRDDVIFGTNTSALPITEMAGVLKDPGRMIGLHFFNPAERMPLLEIICAKQTSDQTLATSVDFAKRIRKTPVVVNDGPGFYVSRQLGGLMGGGVFLSADGVSGEEVEAAMLDFGMPMGPATLADLTGIDINYHVNKTFEREMGERYKVHPLTQAIYELGDYGRKTGAGFMDYTSGKPVPNPRVKEIVDKYLADNGVEPRKAADGEIIELMLANAINEAALMMEQGICDRPADMDLAMIMGTGFPPFRGGILAYADKWGVKNVYEKLVELEAKYGQRFEPAKLIKDMAEQGKTFYANN